MEDCPFVPEKVQEDISESWAGRRVGVPGARRDIVQSFGK